MAAGTYCVAGELRNTAAVPCSSGERFRQREGVIRQRAKGKKGEGIKGFIAMVSGQLGMALMARNRGRNPRDFLF